MAAGVVLLIASVLVVHGVHSSVPPKFIKAAYGVQKALYAKDFGYNLVPIPTYIQRQAHPPKSLPLVGHAPVITARKGRGYKYYRPRGPPRRRKRPSIKRRRPPSSYGVPIYATKYKNYVPSRRPHSPYGRYKKRRPYRAPPRRPPHFVEVHHDIDDYEHEQEIPDEYDYKDYDNGDRGEYSYFDIPSKRLPLQYDKDFVNRHADLYNGGFNSGLPRRRPSDHVGEYSSYRVRSKIRYQTNKEDHQEQAEKVSQDSQETLWPGEVTNVNPKENSWYDQAGGHSQEHHWQDSTNVQSQRTSWQDGGHSRTPWQEEVRPQYPSTWENRVKSQPTPHEWNNHPRPPRLDHQWDAYYTQAPQWYQRPTPAPEVQSWTSSLRPKPLSAAVAVPSRPVVPRDMDSSNHRNVYNWDPSSQTYQEVPHDSRPRYQAHYSEADFPIRDGVDRKSSESHRNQRAFSEPDIGFGEGMEVVDDGVAGWKVKK